jgi:hypothetical protein
LAEVLLAFTREGGFARRSYGDVYTVWIEEGVKFLARLAKLTPRTINYWARKISREYGEGAPEDFAATINEMSRRAKSVWLRSISPDGSIRFYID